MKDEVRKVYQPSGVLQSTHHCLKRNSTYILANTLVVIPAMLHAIVDYIQKNKTIPTTFQNVRLILVVGQSIRNGRLYKQTRELFPMSSIVQTYAGTKGGIFNRRKGFGMEKR